MSGMYPLYRDKYSEYEHFYQMIIGTVYEDQNDSIVFKKTKP